MGNLERSCIAFGDAFDDNVTDRETNVRGSGGFAHMKVLVDVNLVVNFESAAREGKIVKTAIFKEPDNIYRDLRFAFQAPQPSSFKSASYYRGHVTKARENARTTDNSEVPFFGHHTFNYHSRRRRLRWT
jgi:hypothetical protein